MNIGEMGANALVEFENDFLIGGIFLQLWAIFFPFGAI